MLSQTVPRATAEDSTLTSPGLSLLLHLDGGPMLPKAQLRQCSREDLVQLAFSLLF